MKLDHPKFKCECRHEAPTTEHLMHCGEHKEARLIRTAELVCRIRVWIHLYRLTPNLQRFNRDFYWWIKGKLHALESLIEMWLFRK